MFEVRMVLEPDVVMKTVIGSSSAFSKVIIGVIAVPAQRWPMLSDCFLRSTPAQPRPACRS
jgi:hypothetical protein